MVRLSKQGVLFWALVLMALPGANALAISPSLSEEDRREIETLVQTLVSPNKEPFWPGRNDGTLPPTYPSDYDYEAQKRVLAARDALMGKGMAAFAQLAEHARDDRYSYTVRHDSWVNMQVGDVCCEIIELQVEVYRPFVFHQRGAVPTTYWLVMEYRGDLKKWWGEHKEMSLREIQLRGVKWAMEYERKKGIKDKREEAAVMGDLDRLRKRLESSDKPILVDLQGKLIDEPNLKPTKW